jgi:hypothetical protein
MRKWEWRFPRPVIYFWVFRPPEKLPGLNRALLWYQIAFFERKSNKTLDTNENPAGRGEVGPGTIVVAQ